MAQKISATIITFNEQINISKCLSSIEDIVDEIIIVDSFSNDDTKKICISNPKVKFIEHSFEGHIEQKNLAITYSNHDYILSLDADEALSEELKDSIIEEKRKGLLEAYSFNRLNFYGKKAIKTCGWYPDKKVRLFRKSVGKWAGTNPHDKIELLSNTQTQHLKGDLLHYSYSGVWDHISRSMKYSKIASKAMLEKGQSPSIAKMIFSPLFRFLKYYFIKRGFTDGIIGFHICLNSAYITYLKYFALYKSSKK